MKCWRCGQEISDGAKTCPFCGAYQNRAPASSETGRALRRLYDHYGCQEILTKNVYIVNGLGDLLDDAKKIRNLFRVALDAGIGRIYLAQIQSVGNPDESFYNRAHTCLEDAGLGEQSITQLIGWFDEMIGWKSIHSSSHQSVPRQRSGKILGIDLGTRLSRAVVIEDGKAVLIPTENGTRSMATAVGVRDGSVLIGDEALQQSIAHPDETTINLKRLLGKQNGINLSGQYYSTQLLLALILRKLRENAENYLDATIDEAVIVVPNGFTNNERQAILEAGEIAGVEVKRLINATSAAALAYGCYPQSTEKILICNLGCGTFDASVLEMGDGVAEVLSEAGDLTLGGQDFDDCIVQWMIREFQRVEGIDLRQDANAMMQLQEAAEKAKKELSALSESHVFIPNIEGSRHLDLHLSRATFNGLTAGLIDRTVDLIQQILIESGCGASEIDKVFLMGAASSIPAFQNRVRQIMGKDITHGLNPNECMAIGAAIQGAVLTGSITGVLLLDALTNSVGIETAGGVFTRLIARSTTIPTKITQEFSTAQDNQSVVGVNVMQGESKRAADNVPLGRFEVRGILLAKQGVPRIQVTLEVDTNGMIKASGTDLGTGNAQQANILSNVRMSTTQIDAEKQRAETIIPL